jgi:hypothetical protein
MRRRHWEAAAVGDRSRRTDTRQRNSRIHYRRHPAQKRCRFPSEQSTRLDRLRDSRLLRNVCKRLTRKPNGTDLPHRRYLTKMSIQQADFLFVDPARETKRGATSMRRGFLCCRTNFRSSGTSFHSLHATSQALHPMHTVGSVKKPTSTFSCT